MFDDFGGGKCRVVDECARGRLRVRSPGTDCHDALFGLEHVTRTGHDEGRCAVGHGEHRLETPQDTIRPPVLGELDSRAGKVPLVLVELRFEAFEQRERIGGRARKPRQHTITVEAAHFARGRLHDDVSKRYLSVAAERDCAVSANGENRGSVKRFHICPCRRLFPLRVR